MKPKTLIFDVETAPVLAWIWRTGYKISVSHEQLKKGQKFDIICICYKWADLHKVHSLDWGIQKQDSTEMINQFSDVVSKADIVIAHNADRFDIKQLNTQRLIKGQDPINWPVSEDTLKQFRKHFALPSYRLDYISNLLLKVGKDRMNFQDWIDVVEDKKPSALAKMIRYCKKDVRLLDAIYKKAIRHFKPKIHAGVMNGFKATNSCPWCGSHKSWKNATKYTTTGAYLQRRCLGCYRVYKGESL